MGRFSAFGKEICHKGQHIPLDPPIVHMSVYTKGGLQRLFRQIAHPEKVSFPLYEYGQFTDDSGHFCPVLGVVMASRYRVRQVISRQGQSAILLLAEDLFFHKKHVVVKVLHASRYQLGAQETQCLWRLALADPEANSHTVHYLNTFTFDDHYCIVFKPLVPLSLTEIFQDIPAQKVIYSIRKIAVRLLSTLGFLRQQNVIHADLKPENILLRDRNDLSSVTVIDFGNAIQHVHKEIALYYDDFELQTPLYRAPEVMFGMPFGKEIDMWSLGCILAELYLSKPLFMGNSKMDIMHQITSLLGPFPGRTFQRGKFYSNYKHFTDTVEQPDATELLLRHLGCKDYLLADFLAGLLRYNPDERMTPFEAAKHSFLAPEFPFGYLLSPSLGDGGVPYCAVHLTETKYKHRPVIAADIRRSQPSTYDILNLGTTLKEEEEEEEDASHTKSGGTPNEYGRVAKVIPVPRVGTLTKVHKCVEVTHQKNNGRKVSHTQRDQRKNIQQNLSANLTDESKFTDTTVPRNQKSKKYQLEISQPSERQREGYQRHSPVQNRREVTLIESSGVRKSKEVTVKESSDLRRSREITLKESSIVHRSRDLNDHSESARQINSYNNCNQIKYGTNLERVETNHSRSPVLLQVRKPGEESIKMQRHNRQQSRRVTSSLQEEQLSPAEGSNLWFQRDINRRVKEETHQEPSDKTGRSDGETHQLPTENNKLPKEDVFPSVKREREVTPHQAASRNVDRNRSRRYNHSNTNIDSSLSRPGSVFTDINETFVIESDYSSPGKPCSRKNVQLQNRNDQKFEIIRPRPGWFPRKEDCDTCQDHSSVRCNQTRVSVLHQSQDFLNRDTERVSDKLDNIGLNNHVEYLQEAGSQGQRCDHMTRSEQVDCHGNMKQENHLCRLSPGHTKQRSLHIPQSSGSTLSQEKLVESDRVCRQKSPGQPAQNPRQLASLMNAIREEQDLVEQDLSEKESDRQYKFIADNRACGDERNSRRKERQFPVEKRTSGDERKSLRREKQLPENTSSMYVSVSEDEFQSFDENGCSDIRTETDQNSGVDSADSASETFVDTFTGFPNHERRQDYNDHRVNPTVSSKPSSGMREESSVRSNGILESRAEHRRKEHFSDSSTAQVSASRQSSSCDENAGNLYKHTSQSELSVSSADKMKHLKILYASGGKQKSRTHAEDIDDFHCDRACTRVSGKMDSKEMINYTNREKNQITSKEETLESKEQFRKSFNLHGNDNLQKISDGDIFRNDDKILPSQDDASDNDIETDSKTRQFMRSSTESAVVTRSNIRVKVLTRVTDSMTTHPYTSERTQESEMLESDSSKQVLKSKVQVKKVAKKRLNFTQALKPRKNQSKRKTLPKSRLAPITNQQLNQQVTRLKTKGREDPYVFLITPEKNSRNHSEGSTEDILCGRKSGQKSSRLYSDTRNNGKESSQSDPEHNCHQDLEKKSNLDGEGPRTHLTMKGSLDDRVLGQSRQEQMKGSLDDRVLGQSRQEQTLGNQTSRQQEKRAISEDQLSENKSRGKSKNTNYQPTGGNVMAEEIQCGSKKEKKGQKQKRKAVSVPRSGRKRQKQCDNWDPDFNSSVGLGRSVVRNTTAGRSVITDHTNTQNSSEKNNVMERNKMDGIFCKSVEGCERTERLGDRAVDPYINQSSRCDHYSTGRTRTGDYNSQSEDSDETGSWNSSVSQTHPSRLSQNVVKSGSHRERTPRKSHPTVYQHSVKGNNKHLTKSSNLVAIGKSKRTVYTIGHIVNKGTGSKNPTPNKPCSAKYTQDPIQLHHFGQLKGVYREATGMELEREDQVNEMRSSLEEGVSEEVVEFYSSDSEEVMLL